VVQYGPRKRENKNNKQISKIIFFNKTLFILPRKTNNRGDEKHNIKSPFFLAKF
jgi:hypothetical protein